MLTAEEKRVVEERVAATLQEEQHMRELRDYENRLLKEQRDKAEAERSMGDVVFGSKVAIAISGLIFIIVAYLIFKTWAIDLEYNDIEGHIAFIGIAFAILAFRSFYIWGPPPNNRPDFRETGRRRGSRILAVAMLVETILFSILAGYVHCPHDFAHARYNAGDAKFNDIAPRQFEPKPVKLCREGDDDTWIIKGYSSWNSPCRRYYAIKEQFTIFVGIGLAISVISFLVSSKLKDETHG